MAQVDIRINGYAYSLGCADGEEQHLRDMAARVEATVGMVKAAGGSQGRLEDRVVSTGAVIGVVDVPIGLEHADVNAVVGFRGAVEGGPLAAHR